MVATSNEEDLCRELVDIQSALFQLWSTDEALMAQYNKGANTRSQMERKMAYRGRFFEVD